MKLSLVFNVYNEAHFLGHLETILPHVDETIIIEGGAIGPSTDTTVDILKEYQKTFPIKLLRGTFRRDDDGGYKQEEMKNIALDKVTGDFIIFHHADIVYDAEAIVRMREYIEQFPDKALFFAPMLELFFDMKHIRLYKFEKEGMLYRPLCGDVPLVSMAYRPHFRMLKSIGMHLQESWTPYDTMLMPNMQRYHLCFVAPFPNQVEKHVRRITQRDWGDLGEELLLSGYEAVFKTALEHVEGYATDPCQFDFYGELPDTLKDKDYSAFDGREEFYDNIEVHKERLARYYVPGFYQTDKYKKWEGGEK